MAGSASREPAWLDLESPQRGEPNPLPCPPLPAMWPWQPNFASQHAVADSQAVDPGQDAEEAEEARSRELAMERLSLGAWEPSTEERARALGTELTAKAVEGDADSVRDLVDRGAWLDTVDESSGRTPVIQAASLGHADVVSCLTESGADLCHRDYAGE